MQIVIEIPDIKYQWIKDNPLTYDNEYCEAIRNGTPLDKIRAEIEQITDTMGVSYNQYVSKIDVLQIIDKYKENEVQVADCD